MSRETAKTNGGIREDILIRFSDPADRPRKRTPDEFRHRLTEKPLTAHTLLAVALYGEEGFLKNCAERSDLTQEELIVWGLSGMDDKPYMHLFD